MALYEWNESFSVKIEEMDEEHKKLFSIINKLHEALKIGKGKVILESIFKDLSDYINVHFSDEENLLEKVNYPGLSDQKKQHKIFTDKISDYIDSHKKGKLLLSVDVMNFLNDWLINHIKKFDTKYGEFINKK